MVLFFNRDTLTQDMLFGVTKQIAKFIGIWPEHPTWKIVTFTTVNVIIIIMGNMTQWNFLVKNISVWRESIDWLVLNDWMATTAVMVVSVVKTSILAIRKNETLKVVGFLRGTMLNPGSHPDSKKVKLRFCKLGYFMSLALIGFGLTTIVFYIFVPIIINIIRVIRGLGIIRKMPYPIQYPFAVDKSPLFEVGFGFSVVTSTMIVAMLTSVDGIFITSCLYLTAEFLNIQKEIEYLMSQELGPTQDQSNFTPEQNGKLFKKLKNIIMAHNEISRMTNKTVEIFVPIIIIHFLSASLLICFASIALILAPPVNAPTFVCFLAVLLAQLYVYCSGGTHLVESSTHIADSVYFTEWYKADIRIQKMFIIIMVRAKEGSGVKVPFFEASLPTLLTIISTAGSYITLLKTFLND